MKFWLILLILPFALSVHGKVPPKKCTDPDFIEEIARSIFCRSENNLNACDAKLKRGKYGAMGGAGFTSASAFYRQYVRQQTLAKGREKILEALHKNISKGAGSYEKVLSDYDARLKSIEVEMEIASKTSKSAEEAGRQLKELKSMSNNLERERDFFKEKYKHFPSKNFAPAHLVDELTGIPRAISQGDVPKSRIIDIANTPYSKLPTSYKEFLLKAASDFDVDGLNSRLFDQMSSGKSLSQEAMEKIYSEWASEEISKRSHGDLTKWLNADPKTRGPNPTAVIKSVIEKMNTPQLGGVSAQVAKDSMSALEGEARAAAKLSRRLLYFGGPIGVAAGAAMELAGEVVSPPTAGGCLSTKTVREYIPLDDDCRPDYKTYDSAKLINFIGMDEKRRNETFKLYPESCDYLIMYYDKMVRPDIKSYDCKSNDMATINFIDPMSGKKRKAVLQGGSVVTDIQVFEIDEKGASQRLYNYGFDDHEMPTSVSLADQITNRGYKHITLSDEKTKLSDAEELRLYKSSLDFKAMQIFIPSLKKCCFSNEAAEKKANCGALDTNTESASTPPIIKREKSH